MPKCVEDHDLRTAKILLAHTPMWEATKTYGPFTGLQLTIAFQLLATFVAGIERQQMVNDGLEAIIQQQITTLTDVRDMIGAAAKSIRDYPFPIEKGA